MRRTISALVIVSLALAGLFATAGIALAAPPTIEDGFVCPVLGGKAGMNGMHKGLTFIDNTSPDADDFYTVIGPEVSVPTQATNGNNGSNKPNGPYASPGDTDYTAIWPNR